MNIDPATKARIIRNAILSLFIYILPIALMFLTFLVTGQRPWEKKVKKQETTKSFTNKTNLNNGSND